MHRILLFVFLLGYNTTHCPLGVPTRQSSIQSLGNARVIQKTARVPLPSVARWHYDRSPISYSPLGGVREAACATGCRSRPWVDIGLGVRKAIRYYLRHIRGYPYRVYAQLLFIYVLHEKVQGWVQLYIIISITITLKKIISITIHS